MWLLNTGEQAQLQHILWETPEKGARSSLGSGGDRGPELAGWVGSTWRGNALCCLLTACVAWHPCTLSLPSKLQLAWGWGAVEAGCFQVAGESGHSPVFMAL